jgi:hypothetical protein
MTASTSEPSRSSRRREYRATANSLNNRSTGGLSSDGRVLVESAYTRARARREALTSTYPPDPPVVPDEGFDPNREVGTCRPKRVPPASTALRGRRRPNSRQQNSLKIRLTRLTDGTHRLTGVGYAEAMA